VAKLLLLPLLLIPILLMLGIDGVQARAGVMIASLPVALAAFSLSKQYEYGIDEMTSVISLGTLLMLPVALFWDWMLDVMGLWAAEPNPYAPVPPPACLPLPPMNGTLTMNDTVMGFY
jgi:Membrane transport protein